MAPVVSECPVHGAFPSTQFVIVNSSGSLRGNTEPCPWCGRPSRTIEGRYSFDAEGVATMISGPEWSRAALEQVQTALYDAGRAYANTRAYTQKRADDLLDKKLDRIIQQNSDMHAELTEFRAEVQQLRKKTSRSRFAAILFGIGIALTWTSNLAGSIGFVQDVVNFAQDSIAAGAMPSLTELPPSIRPPGQPESRA